MTRHWRMLALGVSAVAISAAAPAGQVNGRAQALLPHHAPRPAIVSALPDAVPLSGPPRAYGGTPIDVLTYHNDAARTGWNSSETDLNPATVASPKFGLLNRLAVDGNVFAQPLLVSGFTMPDGTMHDVLIVATGHDSVYAFDAQTYAVLWKVSMGTPQATNVSSAGSKPGTGVVWLVRRTAPIELEAYDADTLGAPLFAAKAGGAWSNRGNNNPFVTPLVANGRVYAPGYKTVTVFGLTQ